MENVNAITSALQERRSEIIAELQKLDDLLLFYKGNANNKAKKPNGHALPKGVEKAPYVRNGNTQKIISLAENLIKEKNRPVPTQEIVGALVDDGFPQDIYSRGLAVQVAGYLSRKKEFKSTPQGWMINN